MKDFVFEEAVKKAQQNADELKALELNLLYIFIKNFLIEGKWFSNFINSI